MAIKEVIINIRYKQKILFLLLAFILLLSAGCTSKPDHVPEPANNVENHLSTNLKLKFNDVFDVIGIE